jgi:RNA polymerase sigma-70 factor (ECF subfamily)
VQAASIRLLRALRQTTPTSTAHFFNLAALQIRRSLLDLAKHYSRRVPPGLDGQPEQAAPGTLPEEVEELERWQAFHEAADRLPAELLAVFDLRYYQGMRWADIATTLGVDESTASRRWVGARLALCVALGGQLPGDPDFRSPEA